MDSSLLDYLVYDSAVTSDYLPKYDRRRGCRLLSSFGNVSVMFDSRKESDVCLDLRHVD